MHTGYIVGNIPRMKGAVKKHPHVEWMLSFFRQHFLLSNIKWTQTVPIFLGTAQPSLFGIPDIA